MWLWGTKQKRLYRLDSDMMHASVVYEGNAEEASEDVSTRTWQACLGHPARQALMTVANLANLDGVVPQELDQFRLRKALYGLKQAASAGTPSYAQTFCARVIQHKLQLRACS